MDSILEWTASLPFDRASRRRSPAATAAHLVTALERRGVHLEVIGGRVRYRPWQLLRPSERTAIREHHAELRAFLIARGARSQGGPGGDVTTGGRLARR